MQIVTTSPVTFWHSISGTLPNKLWRQVSMDILQELDVQLSDMAQNFIGPTQKKEDANPLIHFRKQKVWVLSPPSYLALFFWRIDWYFPVFLRQNYRFQITLPRTNSHCTWKRLGDDPASFWVSANFDGFWLLVSGSVSPALPPKKYPLLKEHSNGINGEYIFTQGPFSSYVNRSRSVCLWWLSSFENPPGKLTASSN